MPEPAEPRSARRRLVAIDLDHTLARVNTHHYLTPRILARRSRWRALLYRLVAEGPLHGFLSRLVGDDVRRRLSVRLLAGYDPDVLQQETEEILGHRWGELMAPGILELLERHRDREGYETLIVTAAPSFIAEFFARRLGVGWVSSEVEGGRYRLDLTEGKAEVLRERFPEAELHLVVSDRLEDLDPRFRHRVLVREGRTFSEGPWTDRPEPR